MNPFQRNQHRQGKGRTSARPRFSVFGKEKNRVARGDKAALSNGRTARQGRKHAKQDHRLMGNLGGGKTNLPFLTKVKRALGMQSTSRKKRRSALL